MTLCQVKLTVGSRGDCRRVDAYLPARMGRFSRTQIQQLIAEGHVLVDGQRVKPSQRLKSGMRIDLAYPPDMLKPLLVLDDVALDVLWEDESILAINKPAGMPSQPRHRFEGGTLVNAVLSYLDLSGETGPGIMHRLDRHTSGVVLVGKTPQVCTSLGLQFERREVLKEYRAIVSGVPVSGQGEIRKIRLAIGQHPERKEKMAIDVPYAQTAETELSVVEVLAGGRYSLVACWPKTGRTHQIRLHLSAIGHPIVRDDFYGRPTPESLPIERQALHAFRIGVTNPTTNELLQVQAPMPPDMEQTLAFLRQQEEF